MLGSLVDPLSGNPEQRGRPWWYLPSVRDCNQIAHPIKLSCCLKPRAARGVVQEGKGAASAGNAGRLWCSASTEAAGNWATLVNWFCRRQADAYVLMLVNQMVHCHFHGGMGSGALRNTVSTGSGGTTFCGLWQCAPRAVRCVIEGTAPGGVGALLSVRCAFNLHQESL